MIEPGARPPTSRFRDQDLEDGQPRRLRRSQAGARVLPRSTSARSAPTSSASTRRCSARSLERGASLVGVSVDSAFCHRAFREQLGLTMPLLADFHPKGADVERLRRLPRGPRLHQPLAGPGRTSDGVVAWSYASPEHHGHPGRQPDLRRARRLSDADRVVQEPSRRALEAWNRGDIDSRHRRTLRGGRSGSRVARFQTSTSGHEGRDGVRRVFEEFARAWERISDRDRGRDRRSRRSDRSGGQLPRPRAGVASRWTVASSRSTATTSTISMRWFRAYAEEEREAAFASRRRRWAELTSASVPPIGDDDHVTGEGEEAIVYADLGCPHCAASGRGSGPCRCGSASGTSRWPPSTPALRLLHAAAEAAGLQGAFWEMSDSLFAERGRVDDPHLWERVERLGLDLDRFEKRPAIGRGRQAGSARLRERRSRRRRRDARDVRRRTAAHGRRQRKSWSESAGAAGLTRETCSQRRRVSRASAVTVSRPRPQRPCRPRRRRRRSGRARVRRRSGRHPSRQIDGPCRSRRGAGRPQRPLRGCHCRSGRGGNRRPRHPAGCRCRRVRGGRRRSACPSSRRRPWCPESRARWRRSWVPAGEPSPPLPDSRRPSSRARCGRRRWCRGRRRCRHRSRTCRPVRRRRSSPGLG